MGAKIMMEDGVTQGEAIDLTEKTIIYATKDAPFHNEGDEMEVHPETAKRFIAKGYATEKKGAKK